MSELKESYRAGGAAVAERAIGTDGDALMDWVVRCPKCGGFHESMTLMGGGVAIVRSTCRSCRRSFTARSDRRGR